MKKAMAFLLIWVLLYTLLLPVGAFAVEEVSVNPISDKHRGDTVTISGNTSFKEVNIKVLYPNQAVYNIETVTASNGKYSYTFGLYEELPYGTYTVVVGSGSKVAVTTFKVEESTTPPITPPITPPSTPPTSSSGKPSVVVLTPTPTPKITRNEDGSVTVEVNKPGIDDLGTAKVSIDDKTLADAIEQAVEDEQGVKRVEVIIPEAEGAISYKVEIPLEYINKDEPSCMLEIKTAVGNITVPSDMLDIEGEKAELTITLIDQKTLPLSEETLAAIGNKPVIGLNISVDGKEIAWNNPDSPVMVSVPYIPEEGEDYEKISVWYIDGEGNLTPIYNGRYDPDTGMVTFYVSHFSAFAVAYFDITFEDIAGYAWAQREIEVLGSKGIIKGISTARKLYGPALNITRADYTILLVRTLGLTADIDDNFIDVTKDDYYYEEVGIAKKLGITNGVGGDRFAPRAEITRQEMITLTARALKILGKLTAEGTAADLAQFTDVAQVAPYAVESVAALVQEGLIRGVGDNAINPLAKTTRAEVAVLMYRIYNK